MEPKAKAVKVPGPDHRITITPTKGRVTVTVKGERVADTREALTLKEATYPAVQYIPRRDVDMRQHLLSLQGRLRLLQHSGRRGTLDQRRVDLRGTVCRGIGDPGIPRVLPRPG
jgi:hypothetical protein